LVWVEPPGAGHLRMSKQVLTGDTCE